MSVSWLLFVNQTREVFKNLKLVYTSKATSQNQSKLFQDTDVQILCQKTILSQKAE